jgi:uncharacterized membrane protein YeaQ/YmgE (transglycosylase-associated protein family)
MLIIWLLLIGLIAGAVARVLVPGPDPLGVLGTIALGVVGSLIGGTLLSLIVLHRFEIGFSGIIGSIIGAVIALLIYRATSRRRTRAPL